MASLEGCGPDRTRRPSRAASRAAPAQARGGAITQSPRVSDALWRASKDAARIVPVVLRGPLSARPPQDDGSRAAQDDHSVSTFTSDVIFSHASISAASQVLASSTEIDAWKKITSEVK